MLKDGAHSRQAIQARSCRNLGYVFVILTVVTAAGCAGRATTDSEPVPFVHGSRPTEQMLREGIRSWIGTPHRMGGMNRRGIDCSGLVVTLYNDLFHMRLPRTTSSLMRAGRQVDRKRLIVGDLVFFKPAAKYQHVGIYLGHGEFVHTSTSSGVMISRIDDDYWRQCYLTAKRVL